jgi:ABC-type bacteriocin/lantibiotic exporter with double-glycine peptidase domain
MLYEILLTSFFINLLAVAMPLFIMSVYDKIIGVSSTDTLKSFIIGIGIAIIAEFMLRMMRLKSIAWLGVRLDNIVSNTIFERLIFMKAINIEGASISAQIARIKSFESVRKFFTGPLFATIIELPFTVILLIAISFLTGPLVYIPLIVFAAFIILLYYYKPRLSIAMHRAATSSADRQQHSVETFIKMPTLQYNGMAENFWQRYKEKLSKSSIDIFTTNTISSVIDNIAHGVSLLSAVAIIHFGAHMVWDGSITIGALVATMLLFWRVLGPLQTLCSMLPRLEQLAHSINQINRLTAIEMERTYNIPRKSINHINGNVKLLNLGLRYQIDLEPVFFGLDIDVKPGELIAIVGANGTGKTSLLKLINGLYKSQTGTVLIDSTNIKQMDPIGLRSSIAYMPQSADFFEGTIKDNLLLVNPLATDAEILSALKQSRASEAIQELEKGIDTIIHAGDPILDLHLAHALNLARVYLKNSNLVLLDELPNYCLNEELGVAYGEFLKSAKGKKTVFFINNRNDYIKLADRVIVFRSRTKPVIMTSDSFINKYEQ